MKKYTIFTAITALVFAAMLALSFALFSSRLRTGLESIAGALGDNDAALEGYVGALIGADQSHAEAEKGRTLLGEHGYSSFPVDHFMDKLTAGGIYLTAGAVLLILGGAAVFIMIERKKRIDREASLTARIGSALRGETAFRAENDDERELARLFSEIDRMERLRESAANEMRKYVENVAHEIKSPTSGILLNLDLMERAGIDDEKLCAARQCAMRIDAYTAGLLSLARLRAGKVRFNFERTDLTALVRETVSELAANGISAVIAGEGAELNCDRTRIKEALRNLIVNASKHQQGGPVRVELASNGREIVISVADNGPGMKDDALIERYSVGSEDGSSFGIGLSLAKEVAARHSGRLVIMRPDSGSVISLVLPVFKLKSSAA